MAATEPCDDTKLAVVGLLAAMAKAKDCVTTLSASAIQEALANPGANDETARADVIVGGQTAPAPVTEGDLSGWGFESAGGGSKINWANLFSTDAAGGASLVYDGCSDGPADQVTTVGDIDDHWWLFRFNGSQPGVDAQIWLNMYTRSGSLGLTPQGGFYGTRMNYNPDATSWQPGDWILLYVSRDGTPPPEAVWRQTLPPSLASVSVTVQNAAGPGGTLTSPLSMPGTRPISNGPAAGGTPARPVVPDEELLYGTLSTNSGASAGAVNITAVGTGMSAGGLRYTARTVA